MAEDIGERVGTIFRDIRRYYCDYCGICRSKKSLITSHILTFHKVMQPSGSYSIRVTSFESVQMRSTVSGRRDGFLFFFSHELFTSLSSVSVSCSFDFTRVSSDVSECVSA